MGFLVTVDGYGQSFYTKPLELVLAHGTGLVSLKLGHCLYLGKMLALLF